MKTRQLPNASESAAPRPRCADEWLVAIDLDRTMIDRTGTPSSAVRAEVSRVASARHHLPNATGSIAIIGFDGHPTSGLLDSSTINVPLEDIGATTARELIDQIDGSTTDESAVTVLPTHLTIRASTG